MCHSWMLFIWGLCEKTNKQRNIKKLSSRNDWIRINVAKWKVRNESLHISIRISLKNAETLNKSTFKQQVIKRLIERNEKLSKKYPLLKSRDLHIKIQCDLHKLHCLFRERHCFIGRMIFIKIDSFNSQIFSIFRYKMPSFQCCKVEKRCEMCVCARLYNLQQWFNPFKR